MDTSAVGIVTCNSEKYIREMIAHNYLARFDRMIICLDRCDDHTYNVIQTLPSKILEKVDVFNNSPHRPDVGFQYRAYQTIYDRYKDHVEWLAMFDDDEYFYDSRKRYINDMLRNISDDVSQICLPWLNFTHSGHVLSAPPEITRLGYFTQRVIRPVIECKTIVHLKHIVANDIPAGWYHCHYADVSGREITFDDKDCQRIGHPKYPCHMVPEHFDTCLAHYIYGSMEDFVIKYRKWKREKETLGLKQTVRFDSMFNKCHTIEDRRMSLYINELKEILQ